MAIKSIFNEAQNLKIERLEGFLPDCHVDVLRADLIHPIISGNKIWKLDLNLQQARQQGYRRIASFGGAFSNHLHALAYCGNSFDFESIGFVRSHHLDMKNPTLRDVEQFGMRLHPLSAKEYGQRRSPAFLATLRQLIGDAFLIPEGGHNEQGRAGVTYHLRPLIGGYDYICVAVGSGTTVSGLRAALPFETQQIAVGIPVVNPREAGNDLRDLGKLDPRLVLYWDYHWGGYGRWQSSLVTFCNELFHKYRLPLEPIYTGKLFFAIKSLYLKKYFPRQSRILMIHSGGLQGARGLRQYRNLTMDWMNDEHYEKYLD